RLYTDRDYRELHAFPTRRSSDLLGGFLERLRRNEARLPRQRVDRVPLPVVPSRLNRVAADVALLAALDLVLLDHLQRSVGDVDRSEEHTSELQSRGHLVRRLLLD